MPEPLARRLSRLGSSGYIKVGSGLPVGSPGVAVIERHPAMFGSESEPEGRAPVSWESHVARTDELP